MSVFNRLLVAGLPMVPKAIVHRFAKRYVAGETLEHAVAKVRELNGLGAMATLDVLGEEVTEPERAREFTEECVRVLEAIDREGIDSNLSIKPTMFGLEIDEGLCHENVERIVGRAKELGNFVRIDMEDATTTDATLRIYRDLHARYGNVGCVLQAYMRRTLDDVGALPAEGANVRLCKGIYIEPRPIAWKGYETVRHNFVAALEKLIARGVYVGDRDPRRVPGLRRRGADRPLRPRTDRYEFQMLLGVDEELRDLLIDRGHRMRIYTPYGRDWYAYSMRRLRENPEIAGHVAKAALGRGEGRTVGPRAAPMGKPRPTTSAPSSSRSASHRPAEEQEYLCFLERCRLRPEQLDDDQPGRSARPPPGATWSGADALLIGGAGAHSATEEHPFTAPLADVVLRWIDEDRPFFGSCWGHQFLAARARGHGGRRPRERGGRDLPIEPHRGGPCATRCSPASRSASPCSSATTTGSARRPPGLVVLARSERCAHQAVRLAGKPVYGSQFHSEMTVEHMRARLLMYRDEYLPAGADPARLEEILAPSRGGRDAARPVPGADDVGGTGGKGCGSVSIHSTFPGSRTRP